MRLTIDEYSKQFKMSKEMIASKLRTKKLNYIIENGVTYIIVTRASLNTEQKEQIKQNIEQAREPKQTPPAKAKTTVAMVLALYQKENRQLKEKIVQLEAKIDKLIDDKEQMLRDEMQKIEKVYSAKDEQLKMVLELVNTKLLAQKSNPTVHDVEPIKQSHEETRDVELVDEIVELKEYLKTLELEPYQRKIIKKRFLAVYNSDIRIIKQNGKLYLNFAKYDYSDLLEY
ncbi:hypothetical protein [Sulfurimonas sp.]|uniref:hypothetical protein n=1 Tax=Sulfurimonas sp. TaxID=2022749 RepID=UPI0026333E61|nr:hypothetical protein [Sulfurimonas sp.]